MEKFFEWLVGAAMLLVILGVFALGMYSLRSMLRDVVREEVARQLPTNQTVSQPSQPRLPTLPPITTSYLEELCAGYNLSLAQARERILKAVLDSILWAHSADPEIRDRNLNKAVFVARRMIEEARLCGGYNLDDLRLAGGDLTAIGMWTYPREKP